MTKKPPEVAPVADEVEESQALPAAPTKGKQQQEKDRKLQLRFRKAQD
jgi:hypothetical protein